ncbi:MAG: YdcF family protein [Leptolyngbyaceae cyanobacterium SM2_5_2]|nr:YdcF family protein [Leptolyngbyaceae cyanobacterium SM2_5_2]
MVDLSTCQLTSTSYWTHTGWRWLQWLIQPSVMVSILAGIIALPWLFSTWRWKRAVSGLGLILLMGYGLMALPVAAKLGGRGLALLTPSDSGQPADAIVVLGRGADFRPSRVNVAAELWQQGRAPLVFTSGRSDAIELGQMLTKVGVPASAIQGEPCSATTNENAEFTAALLQPQGIKRVILVTDLPHLLRSTLTFRSFGFEVIPHPSRVPASFDIRQRQRLVLREWAGLLTYGLLGRYFSREFVDPGFTVGVATSTSQPET